MILKLIALSVLILCSFSFNFAFEKKKANVDMKAFEEELSDYEVESGWNYAAFSNYLISKDLANASKTIDLLIRSSKKYIFGFIKLIENTKDNKKIKDYFLALKKTIHKIILHYNILLELRPQEKSIEFLDEIVNNTLNSCNFLTQLEKICLEKLTICSLQIYCMKMRPAHDLFFKYYIKCFLANISCDIDLLELRFNSKLLNDTEQALICISKEMIMLHDEKIKKYFTTLLNRLYKIKRENNEVRIKKISSTQIL